MDRDLLLKYEKLKEYIASFGSMAVAFSSGVDSTFLLYAAKEALGDRAIAVTASLHSSPQREIDEAKDYCAQMCIKHFIITTNELEIEGFADNPPNRCYLCKRGIFEKIIDIANSNGITTVAEGSNLDDNGDYRPGLQAIAELGIKSPLRDIGFTKQEIRGLSEHFNIPTWNKPSFACLSSRIPYGEIITAEKLKMVEKAEQCLFDLGFSQLRVRVHGNVARIELIPEDISRFMDEKIRKNVYDKFKEFGFSYVALDLLGYRTGSMNEVIGKESVDAK